MKARGQGNAPGSRKVDVRLVERRKALQCLHGVRGNFQVNRGDVERLARRLVGLGPLAPATLIGALEREDDPVVVELAAGTLEWMLETGSIDPSRCLGTLKQLVVSASLPDSTRMRLLVTLNRLGVDVRDMRYAAAFDDFAAVAETSREDILSEIDSDEWLLAKFLEEIGQLPTEAQLSLIEDYIQSDQPVVYRLYRVLGRSNDSMLGGGVVDALYLKGNKAAAGALAAIGEESLSTETRDRARRAVKALRFAGIRAERFRAPALGTVYSSIVSAMDGAGSRMVWVARRHRRAKSMMAIHLMINDQDGIRDCFGCTDVSREEYDERLEALREPGNVIVQEMGFDYCVGLVRDALACNLGADVPVAPQFLLLMEIFSDQCLDPQSFIPSFAGHDLNALSGDDGLLRRSTAVMEMQPMRGWFSVAESLYPLAERANRLNAVGRPNASFEGDVQEQMERMVCYIIRNELAPTAPILRRRLEMMVDFFLRTKTCSGDDALALLAAAQHLPSAPPGSTEPVNWPDGALPAEENPLLFAIARRSLENARAVLRLGERV